MKEVWKPIERYNGDYEISNMGRVKSVARLSIQNHKLPEKILSTWIDGDGYVKIKLSYHGKGYHESIHRLVAEAFVPNPRNLNEVDHIDTIKTNNTPDNLRWCMHSENHLNPLTVVVKRAYMLGRKPSATAIEKHCVKIKVLKDGEVVHVFKSYKDLDQNSKEILGIQLWNVYVRPVIRGLRKEYHGFTFELA